MTIHAEPTSSQKLPFIIMQHQLPVTAQIVNNILFTYGHKTISFI